jgi:hypothetical protein
MTNAERQAENLLRADMAARRTLPMIRREVMRLSRLWFDDDLDGTAAVEAKQYIKAITDFCGPARLWATQHYTNH